MSLAFEQDRMERDVVEQELSAAVASVLETMFFTSVEEPVAGLAARAGRERIGAQLSFHGARSGKLSLSLERDVAQALAAGFFGDDGQDRDDCASVMAELANMVCGTMLSRLEKNSIFCLESPVLLPPSERVEGWIEKDLSLDDGLLRLAFSLSDRAAPR